LAFAFAIGAGRGEVLRLILTNGLALALTGVVIGMAAAAWASRLMQSLLHDVAPQDPATFVVVGVLLCLVAGIASVVPAWRATRVDPVTALKAE